MKKFISNFRIWIYFTAVAALSISALMAKEKYSYKDDRSKRTEITVPSLWPPDLIPHPHIPQPKPGDRIV